MSETRLFFVPDYYERFICKADRCRANCCHGWNITISMQDYFNLLSVPCSEKLRRKLDVSLHLMKDATPQRYAQILPGWTGNCPLQQEDGLCALQLECGERMLSSTCRYYPRGVRTAFDDECCLSGSCEGVLETMFESMEPIRFKRMELTFDMELPARAESGGMADAERSIQDVMISTLQDRSQPLGIRLERLGAAAKAINDRGDLPVALAIREGLASFKPTQRTREDDEKGFAVQAEILRLMAYQSESIKPLVAQALEAFGLSEDAQEMKKDAYEKYLSLKARFEKAYPAWQVYFEHMLVNHIFYQGYPYSVRHESVWDEYTAICALYASLRALTIGCLKETQSVEALVDVCAAAFKVFDHSAFDHNAMVLLRQLELCDTAGMRLLT